MAAPQTRRSGRGRAERAPHLGPERRRPQVLDAAFRLFLERGYEGTSMEAIAQALSVSKPVVYACYPSKDDLFKALLRREEERVLAAIARALPESVDLADPEQVLVEGMTAFLRAVADSPASYRVIFLGEGGTNAAVARRVERGRAQQVEAVAALALPWVRERGLGEGPEDVARLIGRAVVGLAEAGARTLLAEEAGWTPEALGRILGRIAARGQAAL